ncbi:MAG: hypothetical protein ACE5PV_21240 [Candidatus Poribacteria bacterium]
MDKATNVFVPIKLDGNILHSEVITGFWLKINRFWQKPLPSVLDVLKEVAGTPLREI